MIFLSKKDWRQLSQVFMGGAAVSVAMSAVGFLGSDIWLASTQWLLVAVVLGIFGLYSRMNS